MHRENSEVRVTFDGKSYDPNDPGLALNDACLAKAQRDVRKLSDEQLRPALEAVLAGVSLIAVKLGATAALHHAYSVPVDHDIVDAFTHTINKLVGLNYVPPEKIATNTQENDGEPNEKR
jgi:hypothetical protein